MPTLSESQLEPRSFDELLSISVDDIRAVDIGRANLLCAEGLPKADADEFPGYIEQLDTIAEAVQQYTERSWRLFKIKPAQFLNSENVFRVYTMEHVFRVQFGIQYDRNVRELTESGKRHNTTDSSEVFIHGILSPKRTAHALRCRRLLSQWVVGWAIHSNSSWYLITRFIAGTMVRKCSTTNIRRQEAM